MTRFKKSFTKSKDFARAVLHDKIREGHTTGNRLFVEGDVVYSYGKHYPLAKVKDGTVELNAEKSTPTTEKQKRDFESVAEEEGLRVEKKDFNPKKSASMKSEEESDKEYLKGLKKRLEKGELTDEDKNLLGSIENKLNPSGMRYTLVEKPQEYKNILMQDARNHFRKLRVNPKYKEDYNNEYDFSYDGRPE
jgi:hypothetical protein